MTSAYAAAMESAALFDLADQGKIELAGSEAATFLHNLSTNDVKSLLPGAGCEAFLCNPKARTLGHVFVSMLAPAKILLDMTPGQVEKVFQHLDRHHISEDVDIANVTAPLGMLRLAGPAAQQLLSRVLGQPIPVMPLLHHAEVGSSLVRSHDLLSVPSLDVLGSAERIAAIRAALLNAGVVLGSAADHEVLRVEAGTPVYGFDMDENRFVAEVGRTARAISYTKGCYLGQEPIVMARDRGQVNRTLMGVRAEGENPWPSGTKIFAGEVEVGQTTSSVMSPRSKLVALAYLKRGHQQVGSKCTANGQTVEVAALPFVQ